MPSVSERLARYEGRGRIIAGLIVGALIGGATASGVLWGARASIVSAGPTEQSAQQVVRTQRVELVDEQGALIGEWGRGPRGTHGLWLYGPDGKHRAAFFVSGEIAAYLMLLDESGSSPFQVWAGDNGAAAVMRDGRGNLRWQAP